MGLLTSFLGWPDPRVERVAGSFGALGQALQSAIGSGAAATVGFAALRGRGLPHLSRGHARRPPSRPHPTVQK